MKDSLFGYLAQRFGTSPENLATDALHYILEHSEACRHAFERIIADAGVAVEGPLRYTTQATGDDGERPDMVGRDAKGQEFVVVEAKFWAGLADNQPVTYLRRLPLDRPTLVLVVGPGSRFPTLWPELMLRCERQGLLGVEALPSHHADEYRTIVARGRRVLALISWRYLLRRVADACAHAGDHDGNASIAQLVGLCDRMDTEGFLPLRTEELASGIGRRVVQFGQLADDVVERAVERKVAERATGKNYVWGDGIRWCPVRVAGSNAYLCFHPRLWSQYRETPLWFRVYGDDWSQAGHEVDEALVRVHPGKATSAVRDADGNIWVPLYPPFGAEKAAVLDEVVDQLAGWRDVLVSVKSSVT